MTVSKNIDFIGRHILYPSSEIVKFIMRADNADRICDGNIDAIGRIIMSYLAFEIDKFRMWTEDEYRIYDQVIDAIGRIISYLA